MEFDSILVEPNEGIADFLSAMCNQGERQNEEEN